MKSRFSVLLTVLLFVAGGFVFAQDSGDVGKSWQVVYSNPLSSEGWSGVDRSPVTVSSDYVHVASTTLSGCVLEGLPYCYGVMDAQAGDYLYVTVDLPEAGDYKFSYRGGLRPTVPVSLPGCNMEQGRSSLRSSHPLTPMSHPMSCPAH